MNQIESGETKFRELILYVATKCKDDMSFGLVKMYKLLFRIDFAAYGLWGKSISGVSYERLPNGPAPKGVEKETSSMESDGILRKSKVVWAGTEQHRFESLREPDASIFLNEEIELTDQVIKKYWGQSGKSMSRASHDFIGWKVAKDHEGIPFQAVFLSDRELSDSESEYALTLAPSSRHKTAFACGS